LFVCDIIYKTLLTNLDQILWSIETGVIVLNESVNNCFD